MKKGTNPLDRIPPPDAVPFRLHAAEREAEALRYLLRVAEEVQTRRLRGFTGTTEVRDE
jgi:hypothetical protein